jgi:hypothetical protein
MKPVSSRSRLASAPHRIVTLSEPTRIAAQIAGAAAGAFAVRKLDPVRERA